MTKYFLGDIIAFVACATKLLFGGEHMSSVMKGINISSRCAEAYRNDRLAEYGLSGNHYAYILNICRNPGVSQEELSRIIYINKSNVTRQLAVLEKRGYVTRISSDEDRRITLVFPTQKAHAVFPVIQSVLREWNEYITADFTENEREMLSGMIRKITAKSTSYLEDRKDEKNI